MNKVSRYILLLIFSIALVSCRIDTDGVLKRETQLTLNRYTYTNANPVVKTEILKDSDQYRQLLVWLKNNQDGWEPSPVSFAPYLVVSGQKFNLNFQKSRAVINFEASDGKWHQYTKNIKEADIQFLLK